MGSFYIYLWLRQGLWRDGLLTSARDGFFRFKISAGLIGADFIDPISLKGRITICAWWLLLLASSTTCYNSDTYILRYKVYRRLQIVCVIAVFAGSSLDGFGSTSLMQSGSRGPYWSIGESHWEPWFQLPERRADLLEDGCRVRWIRQQQPAESQRPFSSIPYLVHPASDAGQVLCRSIKASP